MAEKETQVESKETPNLVNMDIDTIVSMVDRVAKEFVDAEDKVFDLASNLPEGDLFNLFFALEFLFKSEIGQRYVSKLNSEANAVYLHAGLVEEMQKRTGLPYDDDINFMVQ
jgi:hypothetical protein